VFSFNALHHLPDFWKAAALVRIARMLRGGGVLRLLDLVYSFEPDEAEEAIADWLAAASRDPTRGWTEVELAHVIRTEHVTFTWLLEPILERAGLEILDRWVGDGAIFAAYTCRRP
jgi:SAM-dependent methyltransferase